MKIYRHPYLAPADETGGGGAGDAGAAAAAAATAAAAAAAASDGKGAGGAAEPTIAELQAQLNTLLDDKAASDKKATDAETAAEAARVAGLSETQRQAERIAELEGKLTTTEKTAIDSARQAAGAKLGINAKLLPLVPADADPRTAAGQAVFERWAQENADLLPKAPVGMNMQPAPKSAVAKILTGESDHPFLSKETITSMLGKIAKLGS